jgi:hypothetical protein
VCTPRNNAKSVAFCHTRTAISSFPVSPWATIFRPCRGGGFTVPATREFTDKRQSRRNPNPKS